MIYTLQCANVYVHMHRKSSATVVFLFMTILVFHKETNEKLCVICGSLTQRAAALLLNVLPVYSGFGMPCTYNCTCVHTCILNLVRSTIIVLHTAKLPSISANSAAVKSCINRVPRTGGELNGQHAART